MLFICQQLVNFPWKVHNKLIFILELFWHDCVEINRQYTDLLYSVYDSFIYKLIFLLVRTKSSCCQKNFFYLIPLSAEFRVEVTSKNGIQSASFKAQNAHRNSLFFFLFLSYSNDEHTFWKTERRAVSILFILWVAISCCSSWVLGTRLF